VSDANVVKLLQPGSFADPLTEVLRNGARALLAQAIEAEVAGFLAKHVDLKTATGLRRVVRHGHLPEREVMTGIGPVGVRQPRVRDRGAAEDDAGRIRFTPAILPPYARRSRSLEVLIPILYLKGISTGDFGGACCAARQGCAGPVGLDHRAAEGDLARRARALEEARSVGQALRLRVGRRHLPAGPS
jgi:putative transposase